MRKIIKKGQRFYREDLPAAAALARIDEMGEPYKREYGAELLEKHGLQKTLLLPQRPLPRHVRGPPCGYHQGYPPGRPSSCAASPGAYWRGDSRNR